MIRITKTDYVAGKQCLKLAWNLMNKPSEIPVDDMTEYSFEQGRFVGEKAQEVFSDGVNAGEDYERNLRNTRELMQAGRTIFEAGVTADFNGTQLYSRADILVPNSNGSWNIIEVKSITDEDKVEKKYVPDVAFQLYCWRKAGVKIDKVYLMHPNRDYVRQGDIKFTIGKNEIFLLEDLTSQANAHLEGFEDNIGSLIKAVEANEPQIMIHKGCEKNNYHDKCQMKEKCWSFLPEGNVFDLRSAYGLDFRILQEAAMVCLDEALKNGSLLIKNIKDASALKEFQRIQYECAQSGKPHVNVEGLRGFLGKIKDPAYYYDMETFSTWLPFFDKSRPYQQIPFEYTLPITRNGIIEKHAFLPELLDDPRIPYLESLEKIFGPGAEPGSVIVFWQSFEKSKMRELARDFPEHAEWIYKVFGYTDAAGKEVDPGWVVDLNEPFLKGYYYNPRQKGSTSLKYVLPAVTGVSYDDLPIGNGALASLQWLQMYRRRLAGENVGKEYAALRQNLLQYCGLDTEGMIWIVDALRKLSA